MTLIEAQLCEEFDLAGRAAEFGAEGNEGFDNLIAGEFAALTCHGQDLSMKREEGEGEMCRGARGERVRSDKRVCGREPGCSWTKAGFERSDRA